MRMDSVTTFVAVLWLLLMVRTPPGSGSGSPPAATNLSFSSINLKTLLEWQMEDKGVPVTFDVEVLGDEWTNWEQKKECKNSTETTCDLSSLMEDARMSYKAKVRAVPMGFSGVSNAPWVTTPSFTPYEQTELGKPQFDANGQNGSILVKVTDLVTPYSNKDGSRKTLGDIYMEDLSYSLTYWKDGSSGRKDHSSRQATFILSGLDEWQLYCFHVRLVVDTGDTVRRGEESDVKCARPGAAKFEYTSMILRAAGICALIVGVTLIILIVWLCRRHRQKQNGTAVSYTAANPKP